MERNLAFLQKLFAAVHDHAAGVRSSTPNIFRTDSVTLRQDVPSIITNFDGRLAAFASKLLVKTSSDPLGLREATPPSSSVV